jgi:hypothetical protein
VYVCTPSSTGWLLHTQHRDNTTAYDWSTQQPAGAPLLLHIDAAAATLRMGLQCPTCPVTLPALFTSSALYKCVSCCCSFCHYPIETAPPAAAAAAAAAQLSCPKWHCLSCVKLHCPRHVSPCLCLPHWTRGWGSPWVCVSCSCHGGRCMNPAA